MVELIYSRERERAVEAEASDRELLWAVRRGSESALDELIGRKLQPLLQLVTRLVGDREEARDIVQMTFIRVWDNRRRFDDRWSPNTWIYRIATNLAIDFLRARRSRERRAQPVLHHQRRIAELRRQRDLSRLDRREVMAIFHELAAGLTERQRAVFLLREVEGQSSREVAEILGCRQSTVRNHLFHARAFLRRALRERYPEYAAGADRCDREREET